MTHASRMETKRTEVRIWKHNKKKNAADVRKRLNGIKTLDFELTCMEWTTLHHLAGSKILNSSNAPQIAKELVARGLSNQADASDRKPLWYAAQAGNDALIPVLLNGLDDSDVNAAFLIALDWQRVTAACTILRERPSFECSEDVRQVFSVLLHKKWGDYKVILGISNERALLSNYLNHACWCGDDDIVKRTLTLGFSVNEHDILGRTPLHNAAQQFHVSTVELLLEAGADPCGADSSGCNPAHYVCASKKHSNFNSNNNTATTILEAFVNAKPSVLNQKNNMGRTALMEALYKGNESIVIFIIKNFLQHLDTSAKDIFGFSYGHYSPLHADELAYGTEISETQEMQQYSHKGRPNKNMKDTVKRHLQRMNKRESLSPAMQMDRTWLIPFGFHGVTKGQKEKTSVLHMCIKMNQTEVLDFLATNENCSVVDDSGRTPLALAVDMVNVDAVSCLLQHVSPEPIEIEKLLRRCKTPQSTDSPWWQIIQMLVNSLNVDKIKDWLIDIKAGQCPQDQVADDKKIQCPTMNLLQYCFLCGSSELVTSICSEIPLADLTEGHTGDPFTVAGTSPLGTGFLLCRQEILTTISLSEIPHGLKDKLLVLSCSFGLYAKEKGSSHYISKCQEPAEVDVVKFIDALVNSGADSDAECVTGGPYPNALQSASFCGLELPVIKLISHGASPFKKVQNKTAIEAAVRGNHEDLVSKMLDMSEESDLDCNLGWKVMTLASSRGHWQAMHKVVGILEEREAIEITELYQDDHGDTCLHYCAREGKDELMEKCLHLLARAGHLSALNFVNKTGRSPLCYASLGNNWRCAFLIIAHLPCAFSVKLLQRNEYMVFNFPGTSSDELKDQFHKHLVRRLLPLIKDLPWCSNVFMKCCAIGDLEAVEHMLKVRPDLVQMEDEKHRGPDFYAAINGRMEVFNYVQNFRITDGYENPSLKAQGQLLIAILINRARYVLKSCICKRLDIFPKGKEDNETADNVRKHQIWDLITRICSEHIDTVTSTVDRFTDVDSSIEYLWSNVEVLEQCVMHISMNFLSLFDHVPCPQIGNYYSVSPSDWSDYKAQFGVPESMPYPDALVIALSGRSRLKSDHAFVDSLIQTLAKDHCMLMTVSIDTFLKCDELSLLCDIFSSRSNVAHYKVKLHAAFLRACAAGHFALSAVTHAFLQDDKNIQVLGLNLSIASDNQNVVQMLSKGICPCSTVSADYCDALFKEFPRGWKRNVRPGWSPIFSAAASNNLPLLHSFLDTCEHVTDGLLVETALVAASRGSYKILEHILTRQPSILYIDTGNLPIVKNWPDLATVSLLACCVKSRQDICSTLVIRHMLSQGYYSQSLVDVLPFACELGLVDTVKSLLAIPDKIAFSECQLNISKCASLELGHMEVFEQFTSDQNQLLPECNYDSGFSKFVCEMCLSDGEEIPLPFSSTSVISHLLENGKETTVFHILRRVEELEILSVFSVNNVIALLKTAVQTQSFGVLEPLLCILDHITCEEKVKHIVYNTVCLAIRLKRAESLRSIFFHRNVHDLQVVNKPHILHVGAIYGDAEVGKVLLEFFEAKDLVVTYNGITPHEVAIGFGNQAMTQVLNPLAINFH